MKSLALGFLFLALPYSLYAQNILYFKGHVPKVHSYQIEEGQNSFLIKSSKNYISEDAAVEVQLSHESGQLTQTQKLTNEPVIFNLNNDSVQSKRISFIQY